MIQIRKAVGAVVLGVALSAGSVPAGASETGNLLAQQCLAQLGFYQGPITGVNDKPSQQAFLAYLAARRGSGAYVQAVRQGIKPAIALVESVGEQLADECMN